MSQQSSGGVSGLTVLLVVFVVLKLTGLIAWSWWYVLAPMWVPLALVAALLGVAWLLTVVGERGKR